MHSGHGCAPKVLQPSGCATGIRTWRANNVTRLAIIGLIAAGVSLQGGLAVAAVELKIVTASTRASPCAIAKSIAR